MVFMYAIIKQGRFMVLTVGLFVTCMSIFAQSDVNPVYEKTPKVLTPSGDAAALGRYGDYPVDISTGVPAINIPVYEINLNGFKLPVSLSYHASGNRVDDVASVVGLGWALQAGGIITRNVRSKPDEINTQYVEDPEPYIRRYKTQEEFLAMTPDDRLCAINEIENETDLESDVYTFSFNGYSGRFAYDKDNQIVLATYDDIKITGGPRDGFVALTPDGSRYWFIGGDSVKINVFTSYRTCWYLKQIITPNADTLDLVYDHQASPYSEYHISFTCISAQETPYWYIEYVDNYRLKFLKQIVFKNGLIEFNYAEDRLDIRPRRLADIEVRNNHDKIIKKFRLGHSYFQSYGGNPQNIPAKYYKRLRLDYVDDCDPVDNSKKQRYSFRYNNTSLPPYFYTYSETPDNYYSQDYWGYFNDKPNTHLIPISNDCGDHSAADRSSDDEAMTATVLTKIIYPTGGMTEYEFETNTGRGGGTKVGGLRIKTVRSYTDSTSSSVASMKSYEYPTGGLTTRWLTNSPINEIDRWFYISIVPDPDNNDEGGPRFHYTSVPRGDLSFNNGAIVIYDYIIEYSGEQKEIKTEYHYEVEVEQQYYFQDAVYDCFTSIWPTFLYPTGYQGPQLAHHFYQHYEKERLWRMGQLTSQIDYKKIGSSYIPVRSITNTWTPSRVRDNVIIGLKLLTLGPHYVSCPSPADPECVYQYFNVYWQTGVKKLTRSVETQYTDNGEIVKTSDYEFGLIENEDGHGFLTREKQTNSAGEVLWSVNRYLPEVYPSPSGVYQNMKMRNMISSPLEVISGKTKNGTDYYLGSTVFEYANFLDIPKISNIKKLQLASPSTTYTFTSDLRLKTKGTFDSYDQFGNLLNATPSDHNPVGYIWGYNESYPIAKAINARNLLVYKSDLILRYLSLPTGSSEKEIYFTTSGQGDINVSLTPISNPGISGFKSVVTVTLTGNNITPISASVCLSTSPYSCDNLINTHTFPSIPVGTYRIMVVKNTDNSPFGVYLNYNYTGNVVSSSSIREFFYEGFEQTEGETTSTLVLPSYAGRCFHTGSYQVLFAVPVGRKYMVEYHYWDGSKWVHMKKNFTNYMTLSDGSAIDEVRVYPADARMTTYTYEPLIGMTSSTDERNMTTYYEYDHFNRLKQIRDEKGNILKTYDYHFQGQ